MGKNKTVRTRIAPSPTGYPHIGTIYQALFNFAFAKKYSGIFIVRIEDTDQKRFVEGSEDVIFSSLDWFGLTEDESPRKNGQYGPYRQSERLDIYHKYAQQLIDEDKAYLSYLPKAMSGVKKDYFKKETVEVQTTAPTEDAPKTVEEMLLREEKNWVVRMRVPKEKTITIHDEIRGNITFSTDQVTEQVLIKSDGFPTYHLAVVVDDYLMEITDIVRAEEWIPSTPKHQLLYEYFGWKMPPIYHTPDLRNEDRLKLGKRHGHTNVTWYQEGGYLPEAILNYLALLGWSHPAEKEIFSLSEFISLFELKDVKAVGPIFDLQKLTWMNGEYIRALTDEKLKEKLLAFFQNDPSVLVTLTGEDGDLFIKLAKERMKTLKDFKDLVQDVAELPILSPEQKDEVQKVIEHIKSSEIDWQLDTILPMLKKLKEQSVSMKKIYQYITYKEQGLPLIELMELWGKETVIHRLEALLT